jgi:signal peptidase II
VLRSAVGSAAAPGPSASALLLAGVAGNLTDRICCASPGPFRGHVVDFLELPHWPIFNVADICINVAAVLILIQAFRGVRVDGSRDTHQKASDD